MTTEFCGWLGDFTPARLSQDVLVTMLAGFPEQPSGRTQTHIGNGLAVGIRGGVHDPVSTHRESVVIAGRPYWSDGGLQRVADEHGHARALQHAYAQYGLSLFEHLRGTFSFALVDAEESSLLLATDRMGICPMFYADKPGHGLLFATAATSLRSHPSASASIDLQSIYYYLYYHVVPSPVSVFTGQQKLEPAQYLHLHRGQLTRDFYWEPEFTDGTDRPSSALAHEMQAIFRDAVRRCSPDQRTGAFLSGGIDSSTVAGMLAEVSSSPARCYSIGFDAAGYDELEYARLVAKHFGLTHRTYYVTPQDVVDIIPRIASTYDEPFGNSSAVPVYYCARLAQQDGIQEMLAGDGGDELFGGNTRYAKQKVFELYHRIPKAVRSAILEPATAHFRKAESIPLLRKVRSYVAQANLPMPDRLETYNFLCQTPAEEILHADLLDVVDLDAPIALMRGTYRRAKSTSLVNRMLYLDWKQTLADNDLRKVSRMCSLAGIEARYPLLDDRVVEFSTRLPGEWKVKGTKLRYFVKKALADFLPKEVITKSKHGFGLPFGVWMRSYAPLRELAYDSLGSLKKRNYVNPLYLDQLIARHRDEHSAYFGEFIWVLMMLELWLAAHTGQP